jgi:hypothetical protein
MGYPAGQVDTVALGKVGAAVQQSSVKFDRAYRGHAAQLGADGGLRGWGTGDVLADAEHAWSAFLRNLAGQVDAHGNSLRSAAKEYATVDQAAASRLTGLGAGQPHPGSR